MTKSNSLLHNRAFEDLLGKSLHHKSQKGASRKGGGAVIYTRVSSQEQAENNSSLSTQLKLCNEYAKRNGLAVKAHFGGTYESAKSDGRKEFQRMLSFAKRDPDVGYIIVYNLDRFSRTGSGAMQLSQELREMGVIVKSVSQEIDSSTPAGRLQESLLHIFNFFDNDTKSDRTSTNMREVMLKGYWPYMPPLGYKNLKPKHRACDHELVITEEGKLIRKAFEWKIEGKHTNKEICKLLRERGLMITEKNFRFVISNPFYAGYITGKLLKGKYVKGQHPAIISLETFLRANELLTTAVNVGIPKEHKKEDLPLKIFAREEESGSPLTGYLQKGIWYYKARGKQVRMNISSQKLNAKFEELLKTFEYKKEHKERLRKALLEGLKKRMAAVFEEAVQLKKRISEIDRQIEMIEERYVLGTLAENLYDKYVAKYREDAERLKMQLQKSSLSSSNLEMAVQKGLAIAENLSQQWLSADFDNKRKLQYLVFPEGITYSKKSDTVRTGKVNSLFFSIPPLERVLRDKKKGNLVQDCLKSKEVTPSGFKPETF